MRVKMLVAQTVTAEGSSTTYLAGHYYLLPDEVALGLVDAGVAEFDGVESGDGEE